MTNKEKLRRLMREYDLSVQDVADLLILPLETIRAYLKPETSKSSRPFTDSRLDHLQTKLRPYKKKPQ